MIRSCLLVIGLLSAAAPAAAESVCHGSAQGPAGQVAVLIGVEDGKLTRGIARWTPDPVAGSSPGAALVLERRFAEVSEGRLGPITALQAVNFAPLNPPAAERARVEVSTEGSDSLVKPWRLYNDAVERLRSGQAVQDAPSDPAGASGMVGAVPFLRADDGVPLLLDRLARPATVATRVIDEEGRVEISRGLFHLDPAGGEALTRQAHQAARTAAATPETSCDKP